MVDLPHYDIIRSRRSSISIQISRDGNLIVKAPLLIPSFFIKNFINSKKDWIEKQLVRVNKFTPPKKKSYQEGEEYMYLGNRYKLKIENFPGITLTDSLNFPRAHFFRIEKELNEWYIRKAKEIITKRLNYYAQQMNAPYKKVYFSDTSSKWGSCSPDNILQFNFRLIMAPLLTIDYVVVHELAHTFEKNHGKRFWAIVEKYKPAYKQYRKWLKNNSHQLTIS